ncbi:virulence factor [Loktanella sp. DJP18]|uniref:virulence factor n=1 Tax=Loktanella sp. DJP18 TaxID=3409788 RepID=UPI003BB5F7D6
MPDVTIIYWRDMPAQVMVGRGRKAAKIQLPERFEQAIDRAAMKSGAAGTEEYLAGMRRGDPYPLDGEDTAVASAEAARLDREYSPDRLRSLIENDGWS